MRKVAVAAIVFISILSDSVFSAHETYTRERYRAHIGQINPLRDNWACSWGPFRYAETKAETRAKLVDLYKSCSGDSVCNFGTTSGRTYIYYCETALIWVNGPVRMDCPVGTFLNPHTDLCESSCPISGTGHTADFLIVSGNTGDNICQTQANNAVCEVHADSIAYNSDTDQTTLNSPEFTSHFCDADDGAVEGQLPTLSNADKDNGSGCGVGNPCNPSTGNKFQTEIDYRTNSLTLSRNYNSNYLEDFGFGKGWISFYVRSLELSGDQMQIIEASGRGEKWRKKNGLWSGDADTEYSVIENNGFTLTRSTGQIENYNSSGQIISEQMPGGRLSTYQYDLNGNLATFTNHFGQSLEFTWNSDDHISTTANPVGGVYSYGYDENNNLTSVRYPDNTIRIYHYENTSFPNHLTGITDENGIRFSTFSYDSSGRATSTGHADTGNGSQELFQINYGQ